LIYHQSLTKPSQIKSNQIKTKQTRLN
jgi:hypothetical protein